MDNTMSQVRVRKATFDDGPFVCEIANSISYGAEHQEVIREFAPLGIIGG